MGQFNSKPFDCANLSINILTTYSFNHEPFNYTNLVPNIFLICQFRSKSFSDNKKIVDVVVHTQR